MTGAVRVPEVQELANLTVKELINLTNLTIKRVEWNDMATLSFTLSNGEHCSAGSRRKVNKSRTFDPKKKITKVEVIIFCNEWYITRMNFYSGQETLVQVGLNGSFKQENNRVEIFEIAADEQLIGAELQYENYNF